MSDELRSRLEAIARELEDPKSCEWIPATGLIVGMAVPERSALGFWRRTRTVSGRRAPLPGENEAHIPERWELTAGWLVECLWAAGYVVTVGAHILVSWRNSDKSFAQSRLSESGSRLEAVVKAAESMISKRRMEDARRDG